MQIIDIIETERLILRLWKESDAAGFAKMNQDERVIEFLRGPMSLEDSQAFIAMVNNHLKLKIRKS
jgi:RimJ/RimL family protein N-acetyltransferase